MLEQLKYVNHLNESFEFGHGGIYADESEIRDFEWTISKKSDRITDLSRSIARRRLPVVIICDTEEAGLAARNRLFEVTEKDALAKQYGRLYVGSYFLRCFVVKSQKKEYLKSKRILRLTLTLATDNPYWISENTLNFIPEAEIGTVGKFADYPMDYRADYYADVFNSELKNANFIASNFRLIIYGACSNPAVTIGGHTYQVDCDVGDGEYLTIDSANKTIILTAIDGTQTNKFNDRSRDSYIFEKIKVGASEVTWDGSFYFDFVLVEERSEPKWT